MNRPQSLAPAFASGHFQHLWISIYSTLILGALMGILGCCCLREFRRCSGSDATIKKVSNEGP